MANTQNSVHIEGNLVAEPELRYTPTGRAVANLTVAHNTRVHIDGEWRNGTTSFFDVVAWQTLAEAAADELGKGARVVVDGRLVQRSWEDRTTGKVRYKVEIVADSIAPSLRFTKATSSFDDPKPEAEVDPKPEAEVEYY